jgi:hypothetical protein
MHFGTFEDGLLVKVDPPFSGGDYGLSQAHIPFLLLSPKYQGDSLFPVSNWPEHVYIFLPLIDGAEIRDRLALNEVRKIAFGIIYLDNVNAHPPTHAGYNSARVRMGLACCEALAGTCFSCGQKRLAKPCQ